MLIELFLAVAAIQGDADKRTAEATVIEERGFAALQEAGKTKDNEQIRAAWERAVREFRKVAKDYPDTHCYGLCQYNVGVLLCNDLGRYDEAIREFKALIASKVDDRDSTGEVMHPYRNYRYQAWRKISECYENLHKPAHAIDAVLAARVAYVSDCGTCEQWMLDGTSKNLLRLLKGIAPGTEAKDLDEALKNMPLAETAAKQPRDPSAPGLLSSLGKRLEEVGRRDDERRVLRALADEFPTSAEGKAAAKRLEPPTKK
jgi:hypothetical protein